jgi:membrane dipeptidase
MNASNPPVFDGHNDMILRLKSGGTFFQRDTAGHLDLVRAREGGLGGGLCAIFTRSPKGDDDVWPRDDFPPTPNLHDAQDWTMEAMSMLFGLERDSEGRVAIVTSGAALREALATGTFAIVMHIEGAEAIDDELYTLEVFHRAGLRSIGPVWSRPNRFAEGVPFSFPRSPDTGGGLTERGRDLVRACNRLGIMVDLSHITEAGFWDVAALSDAPLVASHSNAHALCATPRNLTDKQLDAIRESNGLVGVNFAVAFLREDGMGVADTPVETMAAHFRYLADRMGIEHVGFGSDFDGALIPAAVGDAAGLPVVLDALRRTGFDEDAIQKVTHGNWVRVLTETWGG